MRLWLASRALHRMVFESAHDGPSTSTVTWRQDTRGYPERTYPIQILSVNPTSIRFRGKGKEKEPYEEAQVDIEDGDALESLEKASIALEASHLVAFPTETVYGLGANALNAEAASRIFRAKGRPTDNPLIVHISDLSMLQRLTPDDYKPSPVYSALIDSFWPGPMTLLLPVDEAKVPSVVRCGLKTLGVRMPSHPVARALIATSGFPLAAPSANASGRPSPTAAMHVYRDMTTSRNGETGKGRLPYIIDGGSCQVGVESTVIDGVTESEELRVLRPGGVGVEDIEMALKTRHLLQDAEGISLGEVVVRVYGKDLKRDTVEEANPTTPGMKYRHYSPDADVVLLVVEGSSTSSDSATPIQEAMKTYISQRSGAANRDMKHQLQIGVMSMDDSKLTASLFSHGTNKSQSYDLHRFSLGSQQSPKQAAQRLFEGLRALDGGQDGLNKCDIIFVEALRDEAGVGLAIMNRLQKAAESVIHVRL